MADNLMKLKIITPDRLFYEGEASLVEFNTTEGEIGVLKGHIPLTVVVAPGILNFTDESGEIKSAALHAGFAEVLQDSVVIMAEIIEWPQEIDIKRAESARDRAEERIKDNSADINLDRAQLALQRALARIYVINK